MGRLSVNLCGIELDNPVIPASGTFGYGYEYAELYDINCLGTFSFKGTTKDPRFGNPTPRIAECSSGMINAVGLQNPGVEKVIGEELPKLKTCFHKPVMANISGFSIEDYAYTDRVLEALHAKGYVAASPYQLGSTRVDAAKAEQRRQTLTVCISALLAVIALQVVLLRALFSVQTESYKLMSNIGLVSRSAALSVLWQVLSFTALGQLLGGCAIWVCGNGGIERIAHILRYLPPKYVVILSGVHLAASVAAALWVMRVLKKQVYPLADSFSDIRLDTDKEA